jgi:hypothetical protein
MTPRQYFLFILAIFLAVLVGIVTHSFNWTVWAFLFNVLILIEGEAINPLKVLTSSKSTLSEQELGLIREYRKIVNMVSTIIFFLTSIFISFVYFFSDILKTIVLYPIFAVSLCAITFCMIEWSFFLLMIEKRWSGGAKIAYSIVIVVSFPVTLSISVELTRHFAVPLMYDTIAIFVPFLLSSLARLRIASSFVKRPAFKSVSEMTDYLKLIRPRNRTLTELSQMTSLLHAHLAVDQTVQDLLAQFIQIKSRVGQLYESLQPTRAQIKRLANQASSKQSGLNQRVVRYRVLVNRTTVVCSDIHEKGERVAFLIQSPSESYAQDSSEIHELSLTFTILENVVSTHFLDRIRRSVRYASGAPWHQTMNRWIKEHVTDWVIESDSKKVEQLLRLVELDLTLLQIQNIGRAVYYGETMNDDIVRKLRQIPSARMAKEYVSSLDALAELKKLNGQIWKRRIDVCRMTSPFMAVGLERIDRSLTIEQGRLNSLSESLRTSSNDRAKVAKWQFLR